MSDAASHAMETILVRAINAALDEAANAVYDGGGVWDDNDALLNRARERVLALKRTEPSAEHDLRERW